MKRIKKTRFSSFRKRLINFLVYLGFVAVSLLLILNFQIFPYAAAAAEAVAVNSINEIINNAIYEQLASDNLSYSDFVKLSYDVNGKVSSIETNIGQLTNARVSLLKSVLVKLQDNDIMSVEIPLGTILGGELFSGRGPMINIKLLLAQGLQCTVDNQFLEAGINQTLHRMMLNITIKIKLMVPTEKKTVTLSNAYCIAETIIVGDVPEAYTKINRLLDDIDETTIDDLYDFGASTK
ncbi:MAG: sporulation protein YunB [Clostridiales bacterium]|nr:sporulation protein YunB [Clostridiales bacterium]